jgi:hypothetical protein
VRSTEALRAQQARSTVALGPAEVIADVIARDVAGALSI